MSLLLETAQCLLADMAGTEALHELRRDTHLLESSTFCFFGDIDLVRHVQVDHSHHDQHEVHEQEDSPTVNCLGNKHCCTMS